MRFGVFAWVCVVASCVPVEREPLPTRPDDACTRDVDCGSGICLKQDIGDDFGVCVARESGCPSGRRCEPIGLCDPSDPAACAASEMCQYREGLPACAPVPLAARCIIESIGPTSAGTAVSLRGVGLDNGGKLTPHTTFTWTVDSGTVDRDGTLTLSAEAAGPVVVEGVTNNGAASCTTTIDVLSQVGAQALRVVVVDAQTHQPVENVAVAIVKNGVTAEGITDARGAFTFQDGDNASSVSVFPSDHDWHTVLSPSNDVVIVTERVEQHSITGGFDFSKVKTVGDVKLGIAGLRLVGRVPDHREVFGPAEPMALDIAGLTDGEEQIMLSANIIMGLGQQDFRASYRVSSSSREHSIGWSLAGRVPLGQIGPTLQRNDIDSFDAFFDLLPLLSKFDHGVVTGASLIDGAVVDMKPDTRLFFSAAVTIPRLPDGFSDVTLMVGTTVPAHGTVPLGFAATRDATSMLIDFAPPHDGLEGNPLVLVATAQADGRSTTLSQSPRRIDALGVFPVDAFLSPPSGVFNADLGVVTIDVDDSVDIWRVQFSGDEPGAWIVSSADAAFAVSELAQHSSVDVSTRTLRATAHAYATGAQASADLVVE